MADELPKILLAEDDTDMRRFLVKALQNAGFDVVSYDNGLSAYQRLREEPFELLLTDIVMPEMDGIELARRASELDPDIKIMFITGFAAVALNADSAAPKHAKVSLQAGASARPRQRSAEDARGLGASKPPTLQIRNDRARGIVAGRAGDSAAWMGAGSAMVEGFHRAAVIGMAQHRPRREHLIERHRAVEDVAADEAECAFEVERREASGGRSRLP